MATLLTKPQPVFLDTGYVYALLNTRDQWHESANLWEQKIANEGRELITTEPILFEIANGLAAINFRQQAIQVIDALRADSLVEIVPASTDILNKALDLYRRRSDKGWGLTDCSSFVVMRERGLVDALTPDNHFRQAGFRALMLEEPST
jgi:predicted nucleic acid-binding protein